MKQIRIAPSMLSADFGAFRAQAAECISAGADALHFDVMDGRFVPNITFGTHPMEALRKDFDVHFEAHLMIVDPDKYIHNFVGAGADTIIVQAEACLHLQRTLASIRNAGRKAGVALNPTTSLAALEYVWDDLDHIIVMTVNPGFSGQSFIPAMRQKILDTAALIAGSGKDIVLEIDGGVSAVNAAELVDLGATALVSGSGVFANTLGPGVGVKNLISAIGIV